MNKLLTPLLLLLLLLLSACGDSTDTPQDAPNLKSIEDANVSSYQIYTERSLSNRVIAYKLFEEIENKNPLSGADLENFNKMRLAYLNAKDETQEWIEKYQYLVYTDDGYSAQARLELIMVSLSSMLMRYDDYLLVYANYEGNTELRQLFNTEDIAYKIPENTLEEIAYLYENESDRDAIRILIFYYDKYIGNYDNVEEPLFLYLKQLIEDSASYQLGFEAEFSFFDFFDDIYTYLIDTRDSVLSLFFGEVSETIGNTAGLVETRKGYLYDDVNVTENVKSTLQAGDILLEKTPFRLTDTLIPGYWGHVAIYVGTEAQLRELGIWDNEVVQAHAADIIAGKVIDEALRDGVQLNTVEHFLNVDDLAIMHEENEDLESKKARIILALRQIGKPYDFEYDVETTDKLVCSELVYISYIAVDWATETLVGTATISPDNVAIKTVEDATPFKITLMYYDGGEILNGREIIMQKMLDEGSE